MSEFKVGEIAIIVRFYDAPELAGMECEILAPAKVHPSRPKSGPYHLIKIPGRFEGLDVWAHTDDLKKKKPPQREMDRIVSWEKCDWKPKQLEVV